MYLSASYKNPLLLPRSLTLLAPFSEPMHAHKSPALKRTSHSKPSFKPDPLKIDLCPYPSNKRLERKMTTSILTYVILLSIYNVM